MCALIIICLAIMELTGNNQSFEQAGTIMFIGQMLLPLSVWYLAISKKKKEQSGKLSFKEGFVEGFKITVLFALISPFVFVLYYQFINPEIVNSVRDGYMMSADTERNTVIIVDMLTQCISALIFGSIYSAIISFFVRTKKK